MPHCLRAFAILLIVGGAVPNLLTTAYLRGRQIHAASELESLGASIFWHESDSWSDLLPPELRQRIDDRWLSDVEAVFVDNGVPPQNMKLLLALPRLAYVRLDGDDLSGDYLRALSYCKSLDTLHIAGGFRHPQEFSALRPLEHLSELSFNADDFGTWNNLAKMVSLERISISKGKLSCSGVGLLKTMPNLVSLELRESQRTSKLLDFSRWPRLRSISFWSLALTDEEFRSLAENNKLKRIILADTGVSPHQIQSLQPLASLRSLIFYSCRLSHVAIRAAFNQQRLEYLSFRNCAFNDEDLRLMRPESVLKGLDLVGTSVTVRGIANSKLPHGLETLWVNDTFPVCFVEEVTQRLPKCQVVRTGARGFEFIDGVFFCYQ